MSINGYSKIERGETVPNLARLEQIADILNVPIQELLPKPDGHIFVQINQAGDDNDYYQNAYNSHSAEIEKLKLIIQHKDELLAQQERELAAMRDMLDILKRRETN